MSKRKRKLSSTSKTSLLREIDELNKEINDLEAQCGLQERKLAQTFSLQSLDKIEEKLSEFRQSSPPKSKNDSGYTTEKEIVSLLTRKGKLETLTGVVFEDDRIVLMSLGDDNNNNNSQQWRRVLKGKCLDLSFEVDFVTEEKEESSIEDKNIQAELQSFAEISKLDIKIDDAIAQDELETFLVNAKQEKSLGTVLQVLPQYARYHSCRTKTFLHFKTKYPEYVCSLNESEHSTFMEICNKEINGIQFTICWDIHVDSEGNVVPQLDAFAFCSSDVDEAADVVKSTPEKFRKILSHCGIEKAIELLISIVNE